MWGDVSGPAGRPEIDDVRSTGLGRRGACGSAENKRIHLLENILDGERTYRVKSEEWGIYLIKKQMMMSCGRVSEHERPKVKMHPNQAVRYARMLG